MRITLLNQFYKPDLAPTATLAASVAEHLAASGHEVTVVASRGGYVAAPVVSGEQQTPNLKVHRLWTPRFGKARLIGRLADYLSYYLLAAWTMLWIQRQDVIVSLTTPPFIVLAALLHRLFHRGSRVVLWNMDCYPEAPEAAGMLRPGGVGSRTLRALNRFLFHRVDHVVCLDGAMREMLLSNYGGDRPFPTSVIPNWEPLAMFPRETSPDRTLGRSRDRLVVLYQGNAGVGHEFETVLDCARLLRDDPIEFRFVGGGKWWTWLAEQSQRDDLPRWRVEPYVPKEQTPKLLADADVALITLRDSSRGVMSPSKLHSNLAAGLPVLYVGPTGSNVDEALTRFDCGISLRNGDAQGAADFLRSLIASQDYSTRLSERARGAFESAYCDRETLPQFCELLARL
ncbi:MAG: glycosyltransferase family 4 protein [Planctomycetota bacterium]|nr:glycosyltransferase family 4 protein [Planctomycetota bacterium]